MIYQKNIRMLALAMSLALLASLAGCATGSGSKRSHSSSGSSGSRGSLTKATSGSTGKEQGESRGEGRTRTRNDTNTSNTDSYSSNDDDDYYYEEEDSDGGGGFLVGLILSLFSGGDDDEEPREEPKPQLTDYSEFGRRNQVDNGESDSYDDDRDSSDYGRDQDIKRSNLNFWYSRSHLAGDAVQGFTNYTFTYSWYTAPRYRAQAGFYFGPGKTGSQPNVKNVFSKISEAGIDIASRGYFTPEHSLLGVYAIVGLRAGAMYWSYYTPLEWVAEDGSVEKISDDGIILFVPYIGLGTSLLQTKSVHVGVNFTLGSRLYTDKTWERYENDLFKHVGEYKLNIEASIFF